MIRGMHTLSRRELLALMAAGSASATLPAFAAAHERDWDWLLGNWDVFHSRLKDRLVGSTEWQEFAGKSAFWTTMGGLGNCDDNSLQLPAGDYRGLSVRAFDPTPAVFVSATHPETLAALRETLRARLQSRLAHVVVHLPAADGEALAALYQLKTLATTRA